jgi:hypothetical protein
MKFKPGALLAQRLFLATVTALSYPMSAAAAATDLPVYPAAKTQPLAPGNHSVVSRCGHAFTIEKSMTVDADPHAVAKWYEGRLSGSRTIDLSRVLNDEGGGSNQTTSIEVFAADGSQTVVVSRMHFNGALMKASKTLGMDRTEIGIEGISPPLDPGYIALTAQAAAGGASGQKAKQQMEAACKG